MKARLLMLACKGTHQTTWYSVRGDEASLLVLGDTAGMDLELVCDVSGQEHLIAQLETGQNPFPSMSGLRRYLVSKRVPEDGLSEVSTTVHVQTR